MRDGNYGFQALEHRFAVLGGQPFVLPDTQKIDLPGLLYSIYGRRYISHPRMANLLARNAIQKPHLLTGAEEAEAFSRGEYLLIDRSSIAMVTASSYLLQLAARNRLKVDKSWWAIHAISFSSLMSLLKEHWVVTGLVVLGGLLTLVVRLHDIWAIVGNSP